MTDKKESQLAVATVISAADSVTGLQGGINKQFPGSVLATFSGWDRTVIPAFYTVLTPHNATDKIQVPTLDAQAGQILYADLDGNKTIAGNGASFRYTGDYISMVTSHGNVMIAASNSVTPDILTFGISSIVFDKGVGNALYTIDANPATGAGTSTITFGSNTTASAKAYNFVGGTVTVRNNIQIGSIDANNYTQIWNYETNPIIRLGASTAKGHPADVPSIGYVAYGANVEGDPMVGTNFGEIIISPSGFSFWNSCPATYTGWLFKWDIAANLFYLTNNTGVQTFNFDRLTGIGTVGGIWSYNFTPSFTPGSNQLATVGYVDGKPGAKTPIKEALSVTGGVTVTLSQTPYSENTLLIIRNGMVQAVTTDYTRVGAVITFQYDVTGQSIIAYYTY